MSLVNSIKKTSGLKIILTTVFLQAANKRLSMNATVYYRGEKHKKAFYSNIAPNSPERCKQTPAEGLSGVWRGFKAVYSRSEDFFQIKDLLDVIDLFLPRLPAAGVSVLPSHAAV